MLLYFIWAAISIPWSLFIMQRLLEARRTGILRLPTLPTIRRSKDDVFWFRYLMLSAWSGSVFLLLVSILIVAIFLWDGLSAWSLDGLS